MEESYSIDPALELQCDVCGMKEFYLESGYYYCSICNTQSQQSRHFVEEEEQFNPGAFRSAVTRLNISEAVSGVDSKGSGVKLSSWEVYNIVLKTMADRLIEAGYPCILKNKILQLYTDYLKRREAIFVSRTVTRLSAVTLSEPKMNIYALYGKTPTPRKKWGTREIEKKREREARLDQTNEVGVGSMRQLKARAKRKAFIEEYLGQSQGSDSASHEPSSSSKKRKVSKVKKNEARLKFTQSLRQIRASVPSGKKVTPGRSRPYTQRLKKHFQPETFTMKSVLILVFVALRQIGCKVLFSDILRLSTEGILKIESLTSILHAEEIKLLDLNCDKFVRKKNFDLQLCGYSIEEFLNYMTIEDFPYPSFAEFIPKFIDYLKLPREFECLLSQLNKTIPIEEVVKYKRAKATHKAFPELLILPMIAVLLKMLFGLDDITEKYQSNFARLVNELIDTAVSKGCIQSTSVESEWSKLYVLEDWLLYHRQADKVLKQETLSRIDRVSTSTDNVALPTNHGSVPSRRSKAVIDSCDAIKSIFSQISTTTETHAKQHLPDVTAPPQPHIMSTGIHREDVIQSYTMALQNSDVITSPCLNTLLQNFTKSRIDYIFNPGKYIPILNKAGYKVKVIAGDARNCNQNLYFKSKTIPIFQPYKLYDDFTDDDTSESLNYLLSLYNFVFTGSNVSTVQRHIKSNINCIGNAYCCMSLDKMFPLVLS